MYHVWIANPDGSNQRYHYGFKSPDAAVSSAASVLREQGGTSVRINNIPKIGVRLRCPNLPFVVFVRDTFILDEDGTKMRGTMVSDLREEGQIN
jgi:hypothetical protein